MGFLKNIKKHWDEAGEEMDRSYNWEEKAEKRQRRQDRVIKVHKVRKVKRK